MFALSAFRIFRQLFKGTKSGAKIVGLLDKANHPHVHRCYFVTAIIVYIAHIAVSIRHLELEGGVTALAACIELIAHVCGE